MRADGLRVIGQAGSADAAYQLILRRLPDVTVMDIRLGRDSGIELTKRVLTSRPGMAVLLYTGELIEPRMVEAIMETGARGVALKTADARELTVAIRQVANGRTYIDRALRLTRKAREPTPADSLSEREREVLRLVGDGLTNEQIAQKLFLSSHTVRTHVRNALRKLSVHTRAEAVLALERIEPPIPGIGS